MPAVPTDHYSWIAASRTVRIPRQAFIGGKACDAVDGGTFDTINPATVSINMVDMVDVRTPFGGYKQSGTGRDLSLHDFDKYTETKTTWIGL
ncbi:MAG: hypothetical protein RLZZ366_797 [Pseudomonadota bacterium]